MAFLNTRLNKVFAIALTGLAFAGTSGGAQAQESEVKYDADGFYASPACSAKETFTKIVLTKKGLQPISVIVPGTSSGTLQLYAAGVNGEKDRRWALVGDKGDGKFCLLSNGVDGYPERVVTNNWFKKYFEPQLGQRGDKPRASAPTTNGTVLALTPAN